MILIFNQIIGIYSCRNENQDQKAGTDIDGRYFTILIYVAKFSFVSVFLKPITFYNCRLNRINMKRNRKRDFLSYL